MPLMMMNERAVGREAQLKLMLFHELYLFFGTNFIMVFG